MYAKHSAVYDGAQGEVVKHLAAPAPYIRGAVLALAFVVEAVDLCDLAGFVVSSNKGDPFRISDL